MFAKTRTTFVIISLSLLLTACLTTPVPAIPSPSRESMPAEPTPSAETKPIGIEALPTNPPPATAAATLPARLSPTQPIRFKQLIMLDEYQGWGLEFWGSLLRTQDGGLTWREVTPPQNPTGSMGFFAPEANSAWVASETGGEISIWRTVDGGENWLASQPIQISQVEPGNCGPLTLAGTSIRQLTFSDPNHGWLVANVQAEERGYLVSLLFATQDGGQSWALRNLSTRECSTGKMPDRLNSVLFTSPENGWAGFSPTKWSYFPHNQERHVGGWEIYQTTDGGLTWLAAPLPDPPGFLEQANRSENQSYNAQCGVRQIQSLAPGMFRLEVACFLYASVSNEQLFNYLSKDGGQSWQVWRATGNETFLVDPGDDHELIGWRLELLPDATLNNLQISHNDGQTWETFKKVAWEYASFSFVNRQTGWALVTSAGKEALVRTQDGGQTWEMLHPQLIR